MVQQPTAPLHPRIPEPQRIHATRTRPPRNRPTHRCQSKSYTPPFADGLQSELEKDGIRFGILTLESFTNLRIVENGETAEKLFGFANSQTQYEHLAANKLVDDKSSIQPELKRQVETHELELPEDFEVIAHKAVNLQIKDKADKVEVRLNPDAAQNETFKKLWRRIRPRTKFELHVDSDKLVEESIRFIGEMERIRPIEIHGYRAGLNIDESGISDGDEHMSVVGTSRV